MNIAEKNQISIEMNKQTKATAKINTIHSMQVSNTWVLLKCEL